jgi:phosphoglycolate phosphatase
MLDFDGVIADSLDVTVAAQVAVMTAHGFPRLASVEALLRMVEANWFEGMRAEGVPAQAGVEIDEYIARALATGRFGPFADIPRVVAALGARHTVMIVTSNRGDIVEGFLRRYGIAGVAGVLGNEVAASKVEKIGLARRRHAGADGAWYVGDTVGDIVEARAAGVCTIAAAWGWHAPERLARAKPDHVAATPADLLALLDA